MNAIRSRLKHLNGDRLSFTAKISKPVKTIILGVVDIKIKGTDNNKGGHYG
ncbi:hypothetical protein GTL32_004746 [Salmonella enterica]|nr:hypothetical protein [Salmonella enterica]